MTDTLDAMLWYAVDTAPAKEAATVEILRRRGIHGYVPMRSKRVRTRARPPKWERRDYPIIPSLVFCGLHDHLDAAGWHTINGIRTVRRFVMIGGQMEIPGWQIARMVRRNADDERDVLCLLPGVTVREGDTARVTAGPLEGFTAEVREVDGFRATIIAKLLGSEREVHVDARDLAAE